MATYKKNEYKIVSKYRVEIDYYLDETVFNGEYLKNENGQLVYFGLQNVDGDYLNKLSDTDLTNCITSNNGNYTIKLEKVDNTAAKIFINKPKQKLSLKSRRWDSVKFYYINTLGEEIELFLIQYFPKQCSRTETYIVHQINKISNTAFSFNNLYYVINYNGTGGNIDIEKLKLASTIDITSNDLNKTFLHDENYMGFITSNNIGDLIYTYYSNNEDTWCYETLYTPLDLLSKHYDKIYRACDYEKIFDYSKNTVVNTYLSAGNDHYVYFCAINHTNNTVIPVFKMYADTVSERNNYGYNQSETYTIYIYKK